MLCARARLRLTPYYTCPVICLANEQVSTHRAQALVLYYQPRRLLYTWLLAVASHSRSCNGNLYIWGHSLWRDMLARQVKSEMEWWLQQGNELIYEVNINWTSMHHSYLFPLHKLLFQTFSIGTEAGRKWTLKNVIVTRCPRWPRQRARGAGGGYGRWSTGAVASTAGITAAGTPCMKLHLQALPTVYASSSLLLVRSQNNNSYKGLLLWAM